LLQFDVVTEPKCATSVVDADLFCYLSGGSALLERLSEHGDEQMKRLGFFIFAFVVAGIVSAQAMPLVRTQPDLIVLVASGCGLGVHRGPLDGCTPINDGYFARYYRGSRNAYYVGPVTGGVCGGRGTHIACNYYEICWVACN
jgi:hypothetical protein